MDPAAVLDAMIADPTINGQPVDVDKEFGGQCWDLVELFAERCGVPKAPWAITLNTDGSQPAGYAKNAWLYFDSNPNLQQHFTQIPAGQQQKGDITVYNGHPGFEEGHIAVSLGGTAVFEENADPDGAPAHVYTNRSSTYLLGALRLSGGIMADTVPKADFDTVFGIAQQRFSNEQAVATHIGYVGNPDATNDLLAWLDSHYVPKTDADGIEAIADQRYANEQSIVNELGLTTNPDQTSSIIQAIDALKTQSGAPSNGLLITQKGWTALFDAIKTFFNKNN